MDTPAVPAPAGELYTAAYYRKMSGLSRLLELLFLRERRLAVERHKRPGSLLDVGCGTGEFLRTMAAAGWAVSGVEPSEAAAGCAREFTVHRGGLADAGFGPGAFDAVTLWQVLEHLPDLPGELGRIRAGLKDDGVLIISVPNIRSLQAAAGGRVWFHLDLPRHRWQFSPETLARLLDQAGFRVRALGHFSLEYGPYGWWQTLFNLIGCETNFAYRLLKRGSVGPAAGGAGRRAYTVIATALLALPFLAAAFLLSLAESALGKGGVITAAAEKK